MENVALKDLSPWPGHEARGTKDQAAIAELAQSIREHGILQPIIARSAPPWMAKAKDHRRLQIVCGHRRAAAAEVAGLTEVPAIVLELDDAAALEAQLVENLQRKDLHPLEEADGYRRLMAKSKCDVATIAARIGRSPKYVYDRVRLLGLTPDAKTLFLEDKITAGHAILLARLKPTDQKRALDVEKGGTFEFENLLWNPEREEPDGAESLKTRSVRELQAWVDEHVKFDLAASDLPDLFPETATTLGAAKEQEEKIVPITHDYSVKPDVRDGHRVFGPRNWKRADGKKGSKTCDHSATGVLVLGPGRGEAFKVCTDKACKVHWGAERRESRKRSLARATDSTTNAVKEASREKARRARDEADRAHWKKVLPAILAALASAISKAPAHARGVLADILVKSVGRYIPKETAAAAPARGRTAEDLVRYLAFLETAEEAGQWDANRTFPKLAKRLGLDVAAVLDKAVPVVGDAAPKAAPARKGGRAAKPSRRRRAKR